MKYATYSKYKPSPMAWLDQLPTHWSAASLRWMSKRFAGGTPDKGNEAYWEDGEIPWINSGAVNDGYITQPSELITREGFANSSAKWIPKDALVMALAGQGKTKGMVAQLGIPTTCNQSMAALIPDYRFAPRYLYYWLTANYQNIRNLAGGEARDGLNLEMLGSIPCPVPPVDEQQSITRFLDAKTAQIDALVAQKRQLIDKLKEKRQALIARTVTRGLPPEATKAAGLEMDSDSKCSKEIHPLIGSLPMGWRSLKLRRVATVQGGYAFKSDDFQQEGIPVVRMNSLKRGVLELEGAACIYESECIEAVALRIGDVLYGMSGSVGETGSLGNFAVVTDSDVPCQLNQRVGRFLVRKKELLPGFLVYIIQAPYFYDQILLQATGTAQFNVSGGQIESVLIALPPLDAQRLMVDFLDARCAEIDALQRKTEQALESLYEFRMAIVTSAVTGKIDVRGAT